MKAIVVATFDPLPASLASPAYGLDERVSPSVDVVHSSCSLAVNIQNLPACLLL